MNRNSNAYTFIFAVIMVIVVASVLAFTATSLQPIQNENVRQEKMQNILHTVGIDVERSQAKENFDKYIIKELALDSKGKVKFEGEKAFQVDLSKELNKADTEQAFPLYIADVKGEEYYIIPLRGTGLWDAIWGYIALKNDVNTIKGVVFDHKGETTGLGGEITKAWFQQRFEDEKIFDSAGNLVGVSVVKGYGGGSNKDDNEVDAISGATITGDGVTRMISERLKHYLPYFKSKTDMKVAVK
ncbi:MULTISPECIES: Na(+)-translocating NADH-quinone reductase subunit C [Mesonia]|uniref:Na(+)-translocating NADH-quinone reductase subunit C n=1 Tax=Mesonia oceanica TaxID=2687242 RepID=A0AC61Y9D7_9FLAO|nr:MULTISPECIES: Na(+)-translocating NADH-quinone reductase subunit C [Mesonia]MAN27854.1 Na(+)-translocating NADH-quinone reductase subunit C [Mesonia sp.]MAQ41033.1 Na(+)-translocating NADH-quinone reductase subunit C [Mesonia sp.]MBJ96426.1 Na(+)-translocating NADH-quinone reductase subunit C [Flavobacteriaceae bacterium]VVV01126.1 Na(+)-translocating NADH-quinone reductase subunit C [Mesonia oceanica]|tara:strand:+ start:2169 stop:2897 length:729 start_codon:yes stop_codon:yes gene_type:complete